MRLNTNRDIRCSDDPDAYWRRRFLMLGGGLFILMLIGWQFSGGPSPSASHTATSRASMAARQSRAQLSSAAYAKARPGGLPPHRTATASARPSRSAKSSVARTTQRRKGGTAAPGKSSGSVVAVGARCQASDVVLSLFTSQSSYGPAAQPRFDVYAVSTARGWCQMTYGPASVRVIVTRHGRVVWDSTTCASSAAGTARFERGVPRVLAIAWNRGATRSAGCAGSLSPKAWGTFEAVAMAHGQTSAVRSFLLTR
jgi:hypothetical protein